MSNVIKGKWTEEHMFWARLAADIDNRINWLRNHQVQYPKKEPVKTKKPTWIKRVK